jgi:DNA mismatch endonuclease (patch repair protein)
MADVFSKAKRSEIMSLIRAKNTQAERLVFSHLRSKGIYFQKHYKGVAGCPDIALPKKKKAVFIDGDFWHGRDFNRVCKGRKNSDYWVEKIRSNMARDKKQRAALRRSGWSVIRIWESELKRLKTRPSRLLKIEKFLNLNSKHGR